MFLNESHEALYLKSQYMRHVGRLLAHAIAERGPIPWHIVKEMEELEHGKSTTAAHLISGEDPCHVIPLPTGTSAISDNQGSGDNELSGSQYQVGSFHEEWKFSTDIILSYLMEMMASLILRYAHGKREYPGGN